MAGQLLILSRIFIPAYGANRARGRMTATDDAKNWFVLVKGKQYGPFTYLRSAKSLLHVTTIGAAAGIPSRAAVTGPATWLYPHAERDGAVRCFQPLLVSWNRASVRSD